MGRSGAVRTAAMASCAWAAGLCAWAGAVAAETRLVMVERPGCAWCERWHDEIGGIYDRTDEGRRAPIRRVDLSEPWPSDLEATSRPRVTPTFIVAIDGREAARLEGYPGPDFFWPMLTKMLDEAGDATIAAAR